MSPWFTEPGPGLDPPRSQITATLPSGWSSFPRSQSVGLGSEKLSNCCEFISLRKNEAGLQTQVFLMPGTVSLITKLDNVPEY